MITKEEIEAYAVQVAKIKQKGQFLEWVKAGQEIIGHLSDPVQNAIKSRVVDILCNGETAP